DPASTIARRNLPKIEQLLKETRRLEEIVHEFLKVARGHDLKLAALDLAHFLEELVEFVRPEAERAGVTLRLSLRNDLGTPLIDENYMHRALLNLVQNAVAACVPKGGGDVIVEAGRDHKAIGIAVIDTGVGIAEGARERIFRAYFTTKPGGTGMGLPMAKRIIEEHGGYITFDTLEGQGTRFMILLPARADEGLSQIVLHGEREERPAIDPKEVTAQVNAVLSSGDQAIRKKKGKK
ncbi:MAG: HAMP domain-containing histidine kinase, partial [Planctomycetes bacterium]|nr:HAMP domain-containing histidine kinase [Planctomycetota bacterium]